MTFKFNPFTKKLDLTGTGGSSADNSYALNLITSSQTTVNDSTTYFMASAGAWLTAGTTGPVKLWIPKTGILKAVYGSVNYAVAASSENVTINVRLNNTTNYPITTTAQWTSNPNVFSNASMSVPVTAGDFISFTIVTPVWVTNPSSATFNASVYIST